MKELKAEEQEKGSKKKGGKKYETERSKRKEKDERDRKRVGESRYEMFSYGVTLNN